MKTRTAKQPLTFGELIAELYATCGRQKAKALVRLALKAHWIKFRGRDRFEIS